jgi:hypothetical protein
VEHRGYPRRSAVNGAPPKRLVPVLELAERTGASRWWIAGRSEVGICPGMHEPDERLGKVEPDRERALERDVDRHEGVGNGKGTRRFCGLASPYGRTIGGSSSWSPGRTGAAGPSSRRSGRRMVRPLVADQKSQVRAPTERGSRRPRRESLPHLMHYAVFLVRVTVTVGCFVCRLNTLPCIIFGGLAMQTRCS